jgi:predicted enzyme related to lactoylglutathione lyase
MTTRGAHHGAWVWYELMTSDPVAAETFYRNVVGWEARDAGPGMDYRLFSNGRRDICGMMPIPDEARANGARPSWAGYIAVDDVDATAEAIVSKGGVVHRQPSDIPGIGRFAVVADLHRAAFVLFHPQPTEAPPPAPLPHEVGGCSWNELMAGDLDPAFAFYSDLFGWTKAESFDMGPMGPYQLFAKDGLSIGGMMTKPPQLPVPHWQFYFRVDGIDAAIARIEAGGGKILNGPMEVPGDDWIVQAEDPQGVSFNLVSKTK